MMQSLLDHLWGLVETGLETYRLSGAYPDTRYIGRAILVTSLEWLEYARFYLRYLFQVEYDPAAPSSQAAEGRSIDAAETRAEFERRSAILSEARGLLEIPVGGARKGRVLSKANEAKIQQASELLADVLSAVQSEGDKGASAPEARTADPGNTNVAPAQSTAQVAARSILGFPEGGSAPENAHPDAAPGDGADRRDGAPDSKDGSKRSDAQQFARSLLGLE